MFYTQVFAVYLMIALWMIVLSHTFVNFTFYSGLKKVRLGLVLHCIMRDILVNFTVLFSLLIPIRLQVDVAALVTGAVSVLFALPAVRNNMPGAPPLGAIMDFAVYFWCIIISISHILVISGECPVVPVRILSLFLVTPPYYANHHHL
jgi:Domain of unknown function (DUF4436)